MSSGDYTALRRIQQIYNDTGIICTTPSIVPPQAATVSPNNYLTITNSNCSRLPACNQTSTCNQTTSDSLSDCITTDLLNKLFKYEKFITTTIKQYTLKPVNNMGIGVLIATDLLIKAGDHISCYDNTDRLNFFKGVINGYDNTTGYLSLYKIYDINGSFDSSNIYSIHLIMCEPDIFKLKERIDLLFQYLFNVDLNTNPDYNPVIITNVKNQEYIYYLFLYLFNIDIRVDANYTTTDVYLLLKLNALYQYLFEVNISVNTTFNPNADSNIPTTIQDYIVQLYLYLFNINIMDHTFYKILG